MFSLSAHTFEIGFDWTRLDLACLVWRLAAMATVVVVVYPLNEIYWIRLVSQMLSEEQEAAVIS